MKSIFSISAITALATVLLTGCNQTNSNSNSSTNSPASNSITGGAGGMLNTNMPATNMVADMNQNVSARTNR